MGWDTQINIIVENIINEEIEIAKELFTTDAKDYFQNGISFIKFRELENELKVLFFTYERRKYLPYWTIQEVSKRFSDKYFTVVGSSLDFICGPAGLVKIIEGEIIDSYGFAERFGDIEETAKILENPNPEILFQCFGKDKLEESLRALYIEKHPKKWIEEKYSDNIIEFNDVEKKKFNGVIKTFVNSPNKWKEIKKPLISFWQYES